MKLQWQICEWNVSLFPPPLISPQTTKWGGRDASTSSPNSPISRGKSASTTVGHEPWLLTPHMQGRADADLCVSHICLLVDQWDNWKWKPVAYIWLLYPYNFASSAISPRKEGMKDVCVWILYCVYIISLWSVRQTPGEVFSRWDEAHELYLFPFSPSEVGRREWCEC